MGGKNMLTYTLNHEQFSELQGLAFHIAVKYKMYEREPDNTADINELHKTILDHFTYLDRLQVPFWVQNYIICWAEEWRNTLLTDTRSFLEKNNVFVA